MRSRQLVDDKHHAADGRHESQLRQRGQYQVPFLRISGVVSARDTKLKSRQKVRHMVSRMPRRRDGHRSEPMGHPLRRRGQRPSYALKTICQ